MYKKTVTYVDYDGNSRTEDFYFHLNKAEIMELELLTKGGLEKTIQKIIDTQDKAQMLNIMKDLVLKAYGEKSMDGRRFMKNDEIRDNFKETEAYSTIFVELATNEKAAADFINGIVPEDMKEELRKQQMIEAKIPG